MLTKIKQQKLAQALEYHIKSRLYLIEVQGHGTLVLESNNSISNDESWQILASDQFLDSGGYFVDVKYKKMGGDGTIETKRIYATDDFAVNINRFINKIYII